MERLPYTDQKTSNKSEQPNKKKGRPDLDIDVLIRYAKNAAIGIIMGIGSFMVLLTTFGLSWSRSDWPTGTFTGGMIRTWNIAARHLASVDGVFLKQLADAGEENGRFLTFVLLAMLAVGILISFSRNKWMIILYVLLVGLPSVIWGLHPSVLAVAVLTAGVLLFIVNSDVNDTKKALRGLIYAAVVIGLSFLIICVPAITKLTDRPALVDSYRESVQSEAINSYYGQNPLHNGDLTMKTRKTGNGTALKVTMSNPDSLYLRGFVGDVLEKDGWKPMSYTTYYDDGDLFFWLKENGFNALGQISQSAALAEQGGKKKLNLAYHDIQNRVTVENIDADKRFAYIPYEISIEGVQGVKNWNDNFLTGGKMTKVKEYSFTTAPNKVSDWTNIASKFYTNKVTAAEQYSYLENESHYNAYIYQKYTYISDEDREVLNMAMNEDKGDQKRGHVDYNTAIKKIRQLIGANFTYSDTLTEYKKKYSAMENIFSSHNGYDAHFATAAVMIFRYYGIPARYVEGYLITQRDVAAGQTTVNVPRQNAHAWCEIYVDGIGFVPVEVCPSYMSLMKEADYNIGISSKKKDPLFDKSKENRENPNVVEGKNKTNAGGKKLPKKPLIALGILAAIGLLILIVYLVLKAIKAIRKIRDRRRLFRKGEPREAVRAIYRHMEKIGREPDKEAMDIGNKASYSVFKVSEEDRQTMLKKLKRRRKKKDKDKDKKGKKDKNRPKRERKFMRGRNEKSDETPDRIEKPEKSGKIKKNKGKKKRKSFKEYKLVKKGIEWINLSE
ncbi:MAG: transglutaminase-like domain-containing protein [Bacillota bacterium]|nr:transglutaminase-like domain-containing protein [Bacillota bacterium]